jgi:hypothetical protein
LREKFFKKKNWQEVPFWAFSGGLAVKKSDS